MAALTVAAGSSLGALASRKHTSRRIALTRSTRSPAYKRTCVKTRAGPEDQLGTGMGDDLNYNVLAERMKALQAKESTDTDEVVDAAIELGKPFAVVPCCVFPELFPERRTKDGDSVRTYVQFIDYLVAKHPDIKLAYLPFKGRNRVVYRL